MELILGIRKSLKIQAQEKLVREQKSLYRELKRLDSEKVKQDREQKSLYRELKRLDSEQVKVKRVFTGS